MEGIASPQKAVSCAITRGCDRFLDERLREKSSWRRFALKSFLNLWVGFLVITLGLNLPSATAQKAMLLIVPPETEATDGDSFTTFPFAHEVAGFDPHVGPVRFQQLYRREAFKSLPKGGAFLIAFQIRGDCFRNGFRRESAAYSTNMEIRCSTLPSRNLSQRFGDNVGADAILVLRGSRLVAGSTDGITPCPEGISTWTPINAFSLDTPFFYDPQRGSLLIEFRSSGLSINPGLIKPAALFDTHIGGNTNTTAVAALSIEEEVAKYNSKATLVTRFNFVPVPTIEVGRVSGGVKLFWPSHPEAFKLQWADQIMVAGAWADFPSPPADDFLTRSVLIPATELGQRKFFRLFWDSPQPVSLSSSRAQVHGSEP